MKILYIEDEALLAKIVKESLQSRNYEVLHQPDGEHLMEYYHQFQPDMCLFDVMLPVKDGFSLAKEIRVENPSIPIIFITAKVQTKDVLEGFGIGGNEYIKKPFSLEELIVRLENLYRLSYKDKNVLNDPYFLNIGNYKYYEEKLELTYNDNVKRISYREGQLLSLLIKQKNEVVPRKDILDQLWGDDNFFNSRNLDVYITKLRQYLKQDNNVQIITLKSVGYRLVDR